MQHGSRNTVIPPYSKLNQGFFGRMFRKLPAFEPKGNNDREKQASLLDIARQMVETSTDESKDNEKIPAGYTYFGQFVDHDITFDPVSSLMRSNDPDMLVNFRSPRFDLDNVYGSGPSSQPYLYENRDINGVKHTFLRTDVIEHENHNELDLPRKSGIALIGDPRNDENVIVSQLQLVFIEFHNKVLEALINRSEDQFDFKNNSNKAFKEAQRIVRWTYQYVVLRDFLKRLVNNSVFNQILPNRDEFPNSANKANLCFYRPNTSAYMPVEFSGAAYRLGHTMVRDKYKLNAFTPEIPIFVSKRELDQPFEDLRSGRELFLKWTIQWDLFLKISDENPQFSRSLDSLLSRPLSFIPGASRVPGGDSIPQLAALNLLRSFRLSLPSGQRVAHYMGIPKADIVDANTEDPLWLYILKEAAQKGRGEKLGPVGSRIVAEVFIGILYANPNSHVSIQPLWRPHEEELITLPKQGSDFELADIIKFSGRPTVTSGLPFEV